MDDNTFDDLVRGKLRNYEDPSIDSSALEDLHERMHNFEGKHWYQTHTTTLAWATLFLIFTGINALLLIDSSAPTKYLPHQPAKQQNKITVDSLLMVIDQLQCTASRRPDPAEANSSPKFELRLVRSNESSDPSAVNLIYKVAIGSRGVIPE